MSGLTRRVARARGARKPRVRLRGRDIVRRGRRVYTYAMALADEFAANKRRKARPAKRLGSSCEVLP